MNYGIFLAAFLGIALAIGSLSPAFGQDYNSGYGHGDRDWNRGGSDYDNNAAQRWNDFLNRDENQNFAREFHGNPNVIKDERKMDEWSGVRQFFDNHPNVRRYVYENVRQYDQNTSPGQKWHRELDANPNFADRFRNNPNVINDPNLRNDEPEIAEFFNTNPDVRDYVGNHHRDYNRDRNYND
ncbi:MAG TPA: hypothetical protein VEY94_12835 [Patescibacteria group bacterium]|nr:hypothetical protein [Patescibacteria group bacterium]